MDGNCRGWILGLPDGCFDGCRVGCIDGESYGWVVGLNFGCLDGWEVGAVFGCLLG